jgi:RNase P/RNase MRP subunit POP5
VTPLNTKAMSLVFIVLSTSEVTIREVNSAVSDVRGPRALPHLSEWKKFSNGHFKCQRDIVLKTNASLMPVPKYNENNVASVVYVTSFQLYICYITLEVLWDSLKVRN